MLFYGGLIIILNYYYGIGSGNITGTYLITDSGIPIITDNGEYILIT